MSQGARNCPFLTLTGRPVSAAAIRRSVWRHRKAGICNASTACATGAHWLLSCTSVMTGRPSVSRISAKIGSAALRPIPRAADPEVRLALSKDDLNTRPIARRAAISLSACAISSAWPRLSSWHGPGDERQRQRGAEPGRKRPLADLNDGIVAQGRSPLSVAAFGRGSYAGGQAQWQATRASASDPRAAAPNASPAPPRSRSPQSRSRPARRWDRRKTIAISPPHDRSQATASSRI